MNTLSLFSGVGGLELGLERAGMTVVGQVEIDPFCQQVLAKHWPEVPRHDDARTAVDWWRSQRRPRVDVVAGGFPCQPVSLAGLGRGEGDDRWMWPAMFHVVDELRPEWVIFENVPGLRTRGLDTVVSDLASAGYETEVGTISACAVGAPHVRKRLFGVAHASGIGRTGRRGFGPGSSLLEVGGRCTEPGRHWSDQPRPVGVAHGLPRGVDRRRALGNAVVPQVAEYIGRIVMAANEVEEAA